MISTTPSQSSQFPNITEELAKIREQQKSKGQVFANLFTLILYAQEETKIEALRNIIQSIIKKFPCRIIFIEEHLNEDFDINVTVSSIVNSSGNAFIACDNITIIVGKNGIERVPSLVLPNILPDLPVHLFWGDEPSKEDKLFTLLQKVANRLIFLGPGPEGLGKFSTKTLESFHTHPCAVLDFNWALVAGWRDVLGSCFSTSYFDELLQAQSIKIIYNSSHNPVVVHPDVSAIYLLFWLASRLDWQLSGYKTADKSFHFTFQNGSQNIQAVIEPQELPTLDGVVQSIEIENNNEFHAYFFRQCSQGKVRVQISTRDQCELPYTLFLPDPRKGLTFMKEIFYLPTSSHYTQMLQLLTKLNNYEK